MRHDATVRIFSLLIVLAVAVPAVQAALVVDAGGDRTALAGEQVIIMATYCDDDAVDALNLSASINWSTATTKPEIIPDDDHNGTIQDTYTYLAAGTYAVTVEVANNATNAVARDTLNVTVSPQPEVPEEEPDVPSTLVVDAGGDRTALTGEQVTILATYNGTDVLDALNMSASINWGPATTEPEIALDDDHNGTIQSTYTYLTAGTYAVTVEVVDNATGAVACDTLNVTVSPQSMNVKVVPKTLNQKSNGVMTVFVSIAEWFGFSDADRTDVAAADPSEFKIGNTTPEKVNFCMKDGGTLILKYRRADLDLAAGDGNLTVTGNVTTENGLVPVVGNGAVSVINPGNGKKEAGDNGDGYAGNAKVKENAKEKEKVKDQKFSEEQQKPGGKAKGQTR